MLKIGIIVGTTRPGRKADVVAKWVLGFDELKKHLADHGYTPEWAEKVTGVPSAKIKAIAEGYARAKPAAIFCNAGISHQLGAFDTYRTLAFLAAITGNIGVNGGDSHWICFRPLERWNETRIRFLADGGGCEMRELGELLCEGCAAKEL